VLVTGGNGLIGRRLVEILAERGRPVVSLDNTYPAADPGEAPGNAGAVKFVSGDITDEAQLTELVEAEGVTDVIHLAWLLGTDCNRDPARATYVNLTGTATVLEVARSRGVRRVILASSSSVYGLDEWYPDGSLPLREDAALLLAPHSRVYSGGKLYMENLGAHYREQFGVEVMGLRPSTVYGPGRETGGFAWFSRLIDCAARGESIVVPYRDQSINLIFVDDVANQFAALLDVAAPGLEGREFLNTGGDTCTLERVAKALREVLPEARIDVTDDGALPPHSVNMSGEALVELTGYTPIYSPIERGLEEHVRRVRQEA
jgi:UDP-glucose 4-epimerase